MATLSWMRSILFCRMMMCFSRMISTAARCSDVWGWGQLSLLAISSNAPSIIAAPLSMVAMRISWPFRQIPTMLRTRQIPEHIIFYIEDNWGFWTWKYWNISCFCLQHSITTARMWKIHICWVEHEQWRESEQLWGHLQGNQQMTHGATTSCVQIQNQEHHRVDYPPFHSHKPCNHNCTPASASIKRYHLEKKQAIRRTLRQRPTE